MTDARTSYSSSVVRLTAATPHVSTETVELLQSLLTDAQEGKVTGLAAVTLRAGGEYSLQLRGEATAEGSQMAVAGMLAALQKMALELY